MSLQGIENAKQVIGYDPTLVYLLAVGRIVKDKGIGELVHAFASLYKKKASLRLVLVGTFEENLDPLDDDIMKAIRNHPGIILAGWHDEVEYFMTLATLLVHPSYREGFPNVVLQAGAMECPVICSRIEGNIDIVDENINGLVFTAKDANDLEEKLTLAINDPTGMREMARLLRQKIENNFDRRYVQQQLKERYELLLGNVK